MRHEIGYGSQLLDDGERRTYILIERLPAWAAVLGDAAELVCRVTRNRFCGALCGRTFEIVDKHAQRFEIDCAADRIAAFATWRGWDLPWFMADEPEDKLTEYERLP